MAAQPEFVHRLLRLDHHVRDLGHRHAQAGGARPQVFVGLRLRHLLVLGQDPDRLLDLAPRLDGRLELDYLSLQALLVLNQIYLNL